MTAEQLIHKYQMLPHPEGGWYRETYRSNEIFPASALPNRYDGNRVFSTAIYFLLEKGHYSAFHRISSDECWHFYAGAPVDLYMLHGDGKASTVQLGNDPDNHQCFQFMIRAGTWFAAVPAEGGEFSFIGCTVSPGFEFADFELADRDTLKQVFPENKELIEKYCKLEQVER
jgi:predicted cupin superfamily sugar epimerase